MNDTIAALSTPLGESAIGVIRVSGKDSFAILKKIFSKKSFEITDEPKILFGKIIDGNNIIDEVLVTLFKSPNSYTGENVVEISCHGNPFIIKSILELLYRNGVRQAKPGEFTQRAYLNGKMDLLKAEAINDIIKAHTKYAHLASISQLTGKLKAKLLEVVNSLLEISALYEASIDHSDLEENFISSEKAKKIITEIKEKIENLVKTSKTGKISVEGVKIVIIGAPNTGKSSLMNALLKEDRVIVSDIAGTTRDIISDEISVRGIKVKLFDTAGIRKTKDILEIKGIERTKKILNEADLIFFLIDGSKGICEEEKEIYEEIKDKNFLILVNKIDLPQKISLDEIEKYFAKKVIPISAIDHKYLKIIEEEIEKYYFSFGYSPEKDILITNLRQEQLLNEALIYVNRAILSLDNNQEELIASDLRKARLKIEEIIGLSKEDEILNIIFSKFCIGK